MPAVAKAPLTRKILDKLTCQTPHCTHDRHDGLVLHGRCHPTSTTTASYGARGVVEINCRTCDQAIAEIALSPEDCEAANAILACTDPSCTELPESHSLVLRAPCHRNAGVFVSYQSGHLTITCGKCAVVSGKHHVASGEDVA